jgi:hypothetical protein
VYRGRRPSVGYGTLSPAAFALWVTRLAPLRASTTIPAPAGRLERRRRGSTPPTR